jgi:hypothetical protein
MQMKNKQIDILQDKRTGCYSVLTTLSLREYLAIIQPVYEKNGGLNKQRTALTTSSAKKIRTRMVADLKMGSILPPVVIGIILSNDDITIINEDSLYDDLMEVINNTSNENKAIIDGMQRTTAFNEVLINSSNQDNYLNTRIRVEFWIATKIESLIYRMLVLNTGQVPWNLRRQVEVVFNSVVENLKNNVKNLKIIEINDRNKRTNSGQYHADDLIELFLAFGLRSVKIDVQEKVADEFSRLDFIEATGNENFLDEFKVVLGYLVEFDNIFSQYTGNDFVEQQNQIRKGRDIFTKQPARVGFVVAFARKIFGSPGIERTPEEQQQNFAKLQTGADTFLNRIKNYDSSDMETFLDLETLNERLTAKKGKIGEFDRELFLKAFEELINDFSNINRLTSCWRAY